MNKLLLLFGTLLCCIACSTDNATTPTTPPEPEKGNITFSFTPQQEESTGSKSLKKTNTAPTALVISITDLGGDAVKTNESFTLTNFNGTFLTEAIELPIGEYRLTGFNVVNSENKVIYSAPKEGSEFADLVQNPLPIEFTIQAGGDTPTISPEVLEVEAEDEPDDFGYVTFGFDIVETQNLYLLVRDVSDGNSLGGTFNASFHRQDWVLIDVPFNTGVNKIRLQKDDNRDVQIDIKVEGEDSQFFILTNEEIAQSSQENPFIVEFGIVNMEEIEADVSEVGLINKVTFSLNREETLSFEGNYKFLDINILSRASSEAFIVGSNPEGRSELIRTNEQGEIEMTVYETSGDFGFFNRVFFLGDQLYLVGRGNLFRRDSGNQYTRYNYNEYNDDFFSNAALLDHEGVLYVANDKSLYKSKDGGASFDIVNTDELPFVVTKDTDFISLGGNIYAMSGGVIYFSSDDGTTFSTFTSVGEDYNKIYLNGEKIIAVGDNALAIPENPTYYNKKYDVNWGTFKGITVVGGEYRVYYERYILGGDSSTDHPTSLSIIGDSNDQVIASKEMITVQNDYVYGMSDQGVYFNLSFMVF